MQLCLFLGPLSEVIFLPSHLKVKIEKSKAEYKESWIIHLDCNERRSDMERGMREERVKTSKREREHLQPSPSV